MQPRDTEQAATVAAAIEQGFDSARAHYRDLTARARLRFEARDWPGMMADMAERLALHVTAVRGVAERLRGNAHPGLTRRPLWREARDGFARRLERSRNRELAETFYNSVARRVLGTVGQDPETEFVREESTVSPDEENPAIYLSYPGQGDTAETIERILAATVFTAPFEDAARDAALVSDRIEAYLQRILGSAEFEAIDVLQPIFFRQKLAFLVGRIRAGNSILPLVLPLRHTDGGIAVDAVLMSQSQVNVLFSFTRSHFHVEVERPRDLVVFLKRIMPLKPVAEIYIALGFYQHGKTELYRSLQGHLRQTVDRFEPAQGERGMVMIVFTLPFYGIVFKVIRDRFDPPKSTTRRDVIDRYKLVFTRDRVGRLVEAQEFEGLELHADRFQPELLDELLREAPSTVVRRGDSVVIGHVYVERKVEPLNLYLRSARDHETREAALDYGEAVKELAAANIFPGDFLLKNFGVTRNRRVVFYDYDELCLLTDCRFRNLPPPRHPEDELAAEPWFSVEENDVFPEEFGRFLGLTPSLRDSFLRHHGELLDPDFWRGLQARIEAGEIVDVFPYPDSVRL